MRFVAVFKQYKLLFLIFFLAILILGSLAAIILLQSSGNKINYQGYDAFLQQVNTVATDPSLNSSPYLSKFTAQLNILSDKNADEGSKYTSLVQAGSQLQFLYTLSSNPKIRNLLDTLNTFAKNNFPTEYQQNQFSYFCQDSGCTDDPPPPTLLKIVDEIRNSDFPTNIKTTNSQHLLSLSYYQKKDAAAKVYRYLGFAYVIRGYAYLTKTGANTQIADNLYNYVKSYYPNEFHTLAAQPSIVKTGFLKPTDLTK
jgi:hypothetical protein